ncbi:hypothetical protein, partial [Acinetobacter baumannii]
MFFFVGVCGCFACRLCFGFVFCGLFGGGGFGVCGVVCGRFGGGEVGGCVWGGGGGGGLGGFGVLGGVWVG